MSSIDEAVNEVLTLILDELDSKYDSQWYDEKAKFMLQHSIRYGFLFDDMSNNLDGILDQLLLADNCDSLKLAISNYLYKLALKNSFNTYILQKNTKAFSVFVQLLSTNNDDIADVACKMLNIIISDSVNPYALIQILRRFTKGNDKLNSRLLSVIKDLPFQCLPERYFMFLGGANSGIIIPPINDLSKYDSFSFAFWIYIDPKNGKIYEKDAPFVYSFRSAEGFGYYCRVVGNCLCLTFQRNKNTTVDICVQTELKPKQWTFVTIIHQRKVWATDYVICYLDGIERKRLNTKISILKKGITSLERCSIGCSNADYEANSFLGQISLFCVFSIALSPEHVKALFKLGVHYKGNFKFLNETYHLLSVDEQKLVYDGSLLSSLVLSYNAYFTDQNLILNAALQQSNNSLFIGNRHAQMLESTILGSHDSIYKALHSIGGVKCVLSLLQLISNGHTYFNISIISFLCDLLLNSFAMLNQMLLIKGFIFLNECIISMEDDQVCEELFVPLIILCRHIQSSVFAHSLALGEQALRHILMHIFFNFDNVKTRSTDANDRIFAYVANEMVIAFSTFNRIFVLHLIEQIYFIFRELDDKLNITTKLFLMSIVQHLVLLNCSGSEEMSIILANIRQAKKSNEDNLMLYLDLIFKLLSQNPRKLVPSFDQSDGCRCMMSLLDSANCTVLSKSIKVFSVFLKHSTYLRKKETMNDQGMYVLLANKLVKSDAQINPPLITLLIQLILDIVDPEEVKEKNIHPNSKLIIENPDMIITICSILSHPVHRRSSLILTFLKRLSEIIRKNSENKRRILRTSLWQVYICAFLNTVTDLQLDTLLINDVVFNIITDLIYFAIRHEHDGWRVLVDTLSILYRHTCIQLSSQNNLQDLISINLSVTKLTNFSLNRFHLRVINDLLDRIEEDLLESMSSTESELLNKSSEEVFAVNLAHFMYLLSDHICILCGGLLHLLTSISSKSDNCQFQSNIPYIEDPRRVLFRFANIADVLMIFNTKAMSKVDENLSQGNGTCIRQCFRLYLTCTAISAINYVNNCANGSLDPVNRVASLNDFKNPDIFLMSKLVYHIRNSQKRVSFDKILLDSVNDPFSLIQEHDAYRLKIIANKDTLDDMANAKCVSLSLVYFLSVLVCTEYQRMLSTSNQDEQIIHQPTKLNSQRKITINKLENEIKRSLCITAPFLRMLLTDFSFVLQKSVRGTEDQNIIGGGLQLLQSSDSFVPFTMLICSHEWQVALQRYAGYAFFDLVNESRQICDDNNQHLMKVASEADYIIAKRNAIEYNNEHKFDQFIVNLDKDRLGHMDAFKAKHNLQVVSNKHNVKSMSREIMELLSNNQYGELSDSRQKLWRLAMIEDRYRCRKSVVSCYFRPPMKRIHIESTFDPKHSEDITRNISSILKSNSKSSIMLARFNHQNSVEYLDIKPESSTDQGQLQLLSTYSCSLLSPLFMADGELCIQQSRMYFDCNNMQLFDKLVLLDMQPEMTWKFSDISMILSRSYTSKKDSLEIFLINGSTIFLVFNNTVDVQKVIELLPAVGLGQSVGIPSSRAASLASPHYIFKNSEVTEKWQRREITNFDYIMYLNTIAGRSYQDLNQYPIFPWILADYSSSTLDLNSPNTYRNLSKPMGAQNPDRLAIYKDRFEKWSDNIIPSFYYGSHYSTAAAVLTWLFRIEPYTTGFVEMQGGMFDSNDRIFSSIAQSWQSCLDDLNNVKEIIPEFFYLPEMFINLNKLSFGEANDGTVLGDVVLPPWCSGPEDFVRKHRMALESELVSCQLHNWIDLIFGYKQRGPASIKADNVFYYLTYLEDIPQLSSFDDHVLAKSIATQIKTFGRTPAQLLFEPHPPRNSIIKASPSIYEPAEENMCVVLNLQSQSPIVFLSTYNTGAFPLNSNQLSRGFPASNSYIITISKRFEFACNSYDYINKSSSNVLPVQPDKVICNTRAQRKYLGYSFVPELCVNYDRFAVSPNNEIIIATGYWDKTFRLIHSATSDLRQVIFGHFDIVTCVTIGLTHASYMLATGSKDRTVLTWLFDRKRCLVIDRNRKDQDVNPSPYSILYGHKDTVISVKLSGSGHGLIYSLSMPDKKLTVLQHDLNGNCLRLMFDHDQMSVSKIALMDVAMGGTDDLLIGYNNCIYLITVNGKQLNKLEVPNKQITVLAFDQSGEFVILGCKTGHVLVYSTNGFNLLRQYPRCDAEISALAVTENKRHIVAGLSNGRLVLLNVNFNTLLV